MGDLVLLYEKKNLQHSGKFQMHWLGPYVIRFVTKEGIVQFDKLNGESMEGLVNDNRLKLYKNNRDSTC
jgi:hypothetical protein